MKPRQRNWKRNNKNYLWLLHLITSLLLIEKQLKEEILLLLNRYFFKKNSVIVKVLITITERETWEDGGTLWCCIFWNNVEIFCSVQRCMFYSFYPNIILYLISFQKKDTVAEFSTYNILEPVNDRAVRKVL